MELRIKEAVIRIGLTEKAFRYYREPRSLAGSLAVRLGALVCILWLLSMSLLTCFYARDLGHQAARVSEEALEAFFDDPERMAASLPEVRFSPNDGSMTRTDQGYSLAVAVLTFDEYGVVTGNDGFWMPQAVRVDYDEHAVTAEDVEYEELWLAVAEGKLCFMVDPVRLNGEVRLPNMNDGSCYRGVLTFRDAPHRGGSFFSGDSDWYLPTLAPDYMSRPQVGRFWVGTSHTTGTPARPSRYKTGEKIEDGQVVPLEDEYSPPLELLDGIESGEFCFDADGILMGSRLRGAWQRDEKGKPIRFLLAACGWDPLLMALHRLTGVYCLSLFVFLVLGLLLWLGLNRSMLLPLKKLNAALRETPPEVSPQEFDYAYRYKELQELTGNYLLRRQMLEAKAAAVLPEERSDLLTALENAQRKLLPMIRAKNLKPAPDYRAKGFVAAAPANLEDALLALILEVLPYSDPDGALIMRTTEKNGFLLAEAEIKTGQHLRRNVYAALWEGVYRLPADGDAPGAGLRKAAAAIPGSFVNLSKVRHGLCLMLGLPCLSED